VARADFHVPVAAVLAADDGEPLSDRAERTVRALYEHPLIDATWSRYEPGERGPDPHVHRVHSDAFFIVEGELCFGLGPEIEQVRATAGAFVLVPPHVTHTFGNESDAAVRWLNFHAPSTGFIASMRGDREGFDSFDAPGDGGRDQDAAIVSSVDARDASGRGDCTHSTLGGNRHLCVAELGVAAGSETEVDAHAGAVESFFVLTGEVEFAFEARRVRAGRRTWVSAPPGARHGLRNPGPDRARLLHVRAPALRED
jgi:mannose-6-phosphate isomerase-like protein (cupin superfamily)